MNFYVQLNTGDYQRPVQGEDQGTVTFSILADEVSLSFIPFSSCSTNGDKYISCLFSEEEFARHLLRQMIRDKIAMPEAALPDTVPPAVQQEERQTWKSVQQNKEEKS